VIFGTVTGRATQPFFGMISELGWSPVPNSIAEFRGSRTIKVQHNSLGLRDIEPGDPGQRPTILFIGDSLVWGYDVDAGDRFTELLRMKHPGARIINAGVPGYGTDQEYLLLERLWGAVQPDVVILMVCVENDRRDNTSNVRYGGYLEPYLEQAPDGQWRFSGQPVPWSRFAYFNGSALVHNSWLARLAVSAFVQVRYPAISLPDPTERLVHMMRDFVEARSGKFMIGLQYHEAPLESLLQAQNISFISFDGTPSFDGIYWTPDGHELVASRLDSLLRTVEIANLVRSANE
jgi:hypothetical protein